MKISLKALNIIALSLLLPTMIMYHYVHDWHNITIWLLPDSDDVARVLEVRAWLNGQAFYDLVNHRSNPPFGGEMHWSRLSDLPLAITELALRPFLGNELGEKFGAFLTPIWLGYIFIIITAYAAYLLAGNNIIAAYVAALMIMVSPIVRYNFHPGRVDHHGLQTIFLAIMLIGIFKNNKIGGIILGAALAASLTVGFELLPIEIILIAWIAIFWAIKPEDKNEIIEWFAISFFISIIIGFIIDVAPNKYLNQDNDRLSIAQLVPILFGCISLYISSKFLSNCSIVRRFIVLFANLIIVGIIASNFYILFKPLYWQISPFHYKMWMSEVRETFPLARFLADIQIADGGYILTTLLLCAAQIFIIKKQNIKSLSLENWGLSFLVLLAGTLMFWFYQNRVLGQAASIAVIIIGALVASFYVQYGLLRAILVAAFLHTYIYLLASVIIEKYEPQTLDTAQLNIHCRSTEDFADLAKMPKGLVANDISLGAETLLSTHHDVVTTHFHRDMGRNYLYEIYFAKDNKLLDKLHERNVKYIAFCPAHMEVQNIIKYYPNSLLGRLSHNQIPPYLKEIKRSNGSDIHAFEVIK